MVGIVGELITAEDWMGGFGAGPAASNWGAMVVEAVWEEFTTKDWMGGLDA